MPTTLRNSTQDDPMNEIEIEMGYEYETSMNIRGQVVLLWFSDGAIVDDHQISPGMARNLARALRCGRTPLPYEQARQLASGLSAQASRAEAMHSTPAAAAAVYEQLQIVDATSHTYNRWRDCRPLWIQLGPPAYRDLASKLGWSLPQVVDAVNVLWELGWISVLAKPNGEEMRIRLECPVEPDD